jgi:hypothetical protein
MRIFFEGEYTNIVYSNRYNINEGAIIMQEDLPNPQLIEYLIQTYYGESPALTTNPDDESVSSYWKYHTAFFSIQKNQEGRIISLNSIALGDHRWLNIKMHILDQICILFHLGFLKHRIRLIHRYLDASKICRKTGLDPTLGVFRHGCVADLIDTNIPENMRSRRLHFLMIGDGYGMLSAIIKKIFPNCTIFFVDIGRTLLFQAYYLQKAYPGLVHEFFSDNIDTAKVDFVYCPAENLGELAPFLFDIAINVASMQEMSEMTVARYFDFMRKHFREENFFYCCNSDFNQLNGGEISAFLKYPWKDNDSYLVDEICPWYQYFFAKGDLGNPLSIGRFNIPLIKKFKHPHIHRLTIFRRS